MPTLMTDPRSGGVKKKSGVNVLPIVAETWAKVRDDNEPEIDWLIASYEGRSKTDITVLDSGFGGIEVCSQCLPHDKPVFGGVKLSTGRFVTFYYVDEEHTSVIVRGRAAMHKNGVLNVLEGSDCEIDMRNGLVEEDVILGVVSEGGRGQSSGSTYKTTTDNNHIHKTEYKTTYTPYTAVSKTPNNDGTGGTVVTTKVIHGGSYIHPEKTKTTHTFETSPDEVEEEVVTEEVGGTTTKTTTLKTYQTVETSPTQTTHTKRIHVVKPDSPKAKEMKQLSTSPPPASPTEKQTVTTKTIKTPQGETTVTTTVTETTVLEYYEPAIIPYAFLKDIRDPNDLPEGVDPEYREMSLSDKEFMEVFGMDKFQWEKLPTWKKKGLRREKGLF